MQWRVTAHGCRISKSNQRDLAIKLFLWGYFYEAMRHVGASRKSPNDALWETLSQRSTRSISAALLTDLLLWRHKEKNPKWRPCDWVVRVHTNDPGSAQLVTGFSKNSLFTQQRRGTQVSPERESLTRWGWKLSPYFSYTSPGINRLSIRHFLTRPLTKGQRLPLPPSIFGDYEKSYVKQFNSCYQQCMKFKTWYILNSILLSRWLNLLKEIDFMLNTSPIQFKITKFHLRSWGGLVDSALGLDEFMFYRI